MRASKLQPCRGTVIATLGGIGEDAAIRAEAAHRYELFQTDKDAIDPNLVGAVEGILAATNEVRHYETLYKKFKNDASTPQEQIRALGSLASFADEALVRRTLDAILSGDVRTQDAPYTVRIMLSRRKVGPMVWKWCEQHWPTLMERFPDNSITRMFDGVSSQVDPALAEDVEAFMAQNKVPQAQKSIDQTIERLKVNVAWNQRNIGSLALSSIDKFLLKQPKRRPRVAPPRPPATGKRAWTLETGPTRRGRLSKAWLLEWHRSKPVVAAPSP